MDVGARWVGMQCHTFKMEFGRFRMIKFIAHNGMPNMHHMYTERDVSVLSLVPDGLYFDPLSRHTQSIE